MVSEQGTLVGAMTKLCSTSKSFLGVAIMASFMLALLPLIAASAIFVFKKEDKNLKLPGMVLLVIGALFLAAALAGFAIYILMPNLISTLMGGPAASCS